MHPALTKEVYHTPGIRSTISKAKEMHENDPDGDHYTVYTDKSASITATFRRTPNRDLDERWIAIYDTDKGYLLR